MTYDLFLDLECVLNPRIVNREADQGAAPEETNEGGGEDDSCDGEEDSGGDGDGNR